MLTDVFYTAILMKIVILSPSKSTVQFLENAISQLLPKYVLDRNSLSSFPIFDLLSFAAAAILGKYNNHSLQPFSFIDDNLPKAISK